MDWGQGYKRVPDPITVTLHRQDGSSLSVPYVHKGPDEKRQVETEGALLEEVTTKFNLWLANLGGRTMLKGDRLELADGSIWRVTEVHTLNRGTRFRCPAQREKSA